MRSKTKVFDEKMSEILRSVKKCVTDRDVFGGMIDREKILKDIEEVVEEFIDAQ